jgi:peptidyl-prolyl cis-trans isomerase A (cyclophilin A)
MRTIFTMSLLLLAACGGSPCGAPGPARFASDHVLMDPSSPELRQVPPDSFDAVFHTTEGTMRVRVVREWAPLGAYRFYNLARQGFYDGSRFFRVLPGFVAQFGTSGDAAVDRIWHEQKLPDDPRRVPNTAGTLTFASAGPDTRTTQLFFAYRSNEMLDQQGFTPIGRIIEGMDVLFRLHSGYGETPPQGRGPVFGCMLESGNAYLERRFPALDAVDRVEIVDIQ